MPGIYQGRRYLSGRAQPAVRGRDIRPIRSTSTASLRVVNPSPFLFYLPYENFSLIGCSPEILVRVSKTAGHDPAAGGHPPPRGRTKPKTRPWPMSCWRIPKERAEHIMLVDLGRNDVGRVADYQTVQLTDVMKVERYSHVMHITSNVTGKLEAGADRL